MSVYTLFVAYVLLVVAGLTVMALAPVVVQLLRNDARP